ncbi:hypothetical protein CAC42_5638 [Sphaceloma murrayae]|uniref:Uncharacterized protein n=1 Tax=Sphaceloma murrayae TaxID=2082308 RepID=A0A2K1QYR1_9PEZI|nr:hypothetical protein CAC42_5638 [Sphaceloma murrayae]
MAARDNASSHVRGASNDSNSYSFSDRQSADGYSAKPTTPRGTSHQDPGHGNANTIFGGIVMPHTHRQQPYQRLASTGDLAAIDADPDVEREEDDIVDAFTPTGSKAGLGIATQARKSKPPKRVSIQELPKDSPPLASPSIDGTTPSLSASLFKSPTTSTPDLSFYSYPHQHTSDGGHGAYELPGESARHKAKTPSISSLQSGYQRSYQIPDDEPFARSSTPGARSAYDGRFHPPLACPPARPFYERGCSWFAIMLIIFSVFSTVFSGIFLVIALIGKRWGNSIRTSGNFTPADAIVLTNVFAKAIEISFVAVVVTFLGQALSLRAFNKSSGRGVTLAELSMRNWVLQPGTMFTHPSTVKYGALSILGIFSLVATILATLYTTAAQAVVQPQLRFSNWEPRIMRGAVKSSFGNVNYVHGRCETPIRESVDPEYYDSTCFQIQNSAQSFLNYQRYMANWATMANTGNGSSDMAYRPPGFGLMYENTTITAPWVDVVDPREDSDGHIITNVSLAFPHPGVFQAARDPANGILQPQDLDGLGLYGVKASVASPVVNALCMQTSSEEDLAPLVYDMWPNAPKPFNSTAWPQEQIGGLNMTNFKNTTKFDDLFKWGPQYGTGTSSQRAYPIFPKLPQPYNTVINNTQFGFYGRDSFYLLGQGDGMSSGGNPISGKYVLCELSASLTPHCSTRYNATASGGSMEAVCNDPNDDLRLIVSNSSAIQGNMTRSKDWFDVALEWGSSLSLGTGISDGKASNSRLLMQLLLDGPSLSKSLPSVSEALAVMAGSTLLFSSYDAPFNTEQWNYTSNPLVTPQHQYFNASVRGQEYASGGVAGSQKGFLLILFPVFIANVFILGYLIWLRGLVTDFSEPPNLFSLAINSPPSHLLAGSCGAGPHGDQYKVNWFLQQEGDHLYMESVGEPKGFKQNHRRDWEGEGDAGLELVSSPHQAQFRRLSRRVNVL